MKQISSHYGDTEVFMVIGNTAIMTCKMHEHKEKKNVQGPCFEQLFI